MKNCGSAVTLWWGCGGNVTRAKMLVVAPFIPVRGCISVAEGVPAKGWNPREGIHLTVCTVAVHRRWFWWGENTKKMAMIFLRVKTDDILQSASISHRESAVLRGKRHLRCDECPPRIPSPHLLRFVWCYKKEGLFEADSITLSFPIQTCSEGTSFSVTPHRATERSDGVGKWRRVISLRGARETSHNAYEVPAAKGRRRKNTAQINFESRIML